MKSLYPSCEPFAVHRMKVDGLHEIYLEECGNPRGCPVVFLHGGPGSGCSPDHRRYFDPEFYRIVLFDQRGAGRSEPQGETAGNRTADLVADMEAIRGRLNIEKWLLFGGSWGATLALAYATACPDRVSGLILRGSFLARETDLEWFFVGLRRLFPQAWERFTRGMPDGFGLSGLIDWYHDALQGDDPERSLQAARRWNDWGAQAVNWHRDRSGQAAAGEAETEERNARLLAKVRLETHYAHHRYFLDDGVLAGVASIPRVPVSIVQGRFDITCTMAAAWLLHKRIPGSRFIEVPQAGHLIDEPAMISALVGETDRLRSSLNTNME